MLLILTTHQSIFGPAIIHHHFSHFITKHTPQNICEKSDSKCGVMTRSAIYFVTDWSKRISTIERQSINFLYIEGQKISASLSHRKFNTLCAIIYPLHPSIFQASIMAIFLSQSALAISPNERQFAALLPFD